MQGFKKAAVGIALAVSMLSNIGLRAFAQDELEISFEPVELTDGATIVDSDEVLQYMYGLTDIGSRLMGTPNEYESVDYIKDMMLASYAPENVIVTEVELSDIRKAPVSAITLYGDEYGDDGKIIYYGNLYAYDESDAFEVEGEDVIVVTDGTIDEDVEGKYPMTALSAISVEGKEMNEVIAEFAKTATDGGASGVIIYNDIPNSNNLIGRLIIQGDFTADIPVLGFDGVAGEIFKEAISNGEVLTVESYHRGNSNNVTAIKEADINPENPSAIIHVTGHYDSVMGTMGANDNATGAVGVMVLSKIFSTVDTGTVELRFSALGAEEGGLNGSLSYATALSDEEKAISINLNMDMLATDEDFVNALSLDIYGGVFNLPAALVIGAALEDGFELLEDTDNVRYFNYGGSDHVNFQRQGMNAASMITVIDEDDYTENEYHLPSDSMENNYSIDRHMQSLSLMAGGISAAIEHNLTLEAEISNVGNVYTIENTDALEALFPTIKVYVTQKYHEGDLLIELDTATENQFTLPSGDCDVEIFGCGYGAANLMGTYDKAKVEEYQEPLGAFNLGDISMTRGDFTHLLSEYFEVDTATYMENSFTDVTYAHYYYNAVSWASEHAIINGVAADSFAPDTLVTNEQVATILANYADSMGIALAQDESEISFANASAINAWAMDSVMELQKAGIITDANYEPQANIKAVDAVILLDAFTKIVSE